MDRLDVERRRRWRCRGRRKRGRPQRRFMDVVMEDTEGIGVTEEDAQDRVRWR